MRSNEINSEYRWLTCYPTRDAPYFWSCLTPISGLGTDFSRRHYRLRSSSAARQRHARAALVALVGAIADAVPTRSAHRRGFGSAARGWRAGTVACGELGVD